MTISKEESLLLSKIHDLVKKIQEFLAQIGCRDQQIARYFALKVFQSKQLIEQNETVASFYQRLIKEYLKVGKQKNKCLRIPLIHILTKLEIENGMIVSYQKQLQQQKVASKAVEKKRELLNEQFAYKPRRLFDMNLMREESAEGNKGIVRDLEQIKSFERDLQESLMKTKLLKRLIQQRIEQDLDDPFNRCFSGFQKLLSLESSG